MPKPARRIPRWLTIDIMILVIGTVIIIVSALWLGTNIEFMVAAPEMNVHVPLEAQPPIVMTTSKTMSVRLYSMAFDHHNPAGVS